MGVIIPASFAENYRVMYGVAGERWLAEFPALVHRLEQEWNVEAGEPYPLSYNWVAPAVRRMNGAVEPVVLKVGMTTDDELRSEMVSLLAFEGRGIARLLEHSLERGAMLLEKVEPGTPLVEMLGDFGDDKSTRIAAEVMHSLWTSPPVADRDLLITTQRWGHGFQKLRDAFGGETGPFPKRLVERAERTWAALEASPAAEPVLMHGDLHHWNILRGTRAPWLAIDPKGLIAEPAYEPGAFLRNPWPEAKDVPELLRCLPRRAAIFSEMLEQDYQRILAWSFTQAVLSAWWTYESFGRVDDVMIPFAEGHEALLDGNAP